MSIHEARRLGTEARQLLASSFDPLEERERLKIDAKRIERVLTFEAAAFKVHNDLKDGWNNLKHSQQWINTLSTYALPLIGSKPFGDTTVNDIAEVLHPIWLSKSETASRVKQ